MKNIDGIAVGTYIYLTFDDGSGSGYYEVIKNRLTTEIQDLSDGKSFPLFTHDKYTYNVLWLQKKDKIIFTNDKPSDGVQRIYEILGMKMFGKDLILTLWDTLNTNRFERILTKSAIEQIKFFE